LINVLFTKLALHQGTRGLSTPEALNIYLLNQLTIRLIGSLFQLLPGEIYINNCLTAGQRFNRNLHMSSNKLCDVCSLVQGVVTRRGPAQSIEIW